MRFSQRKAGVLKQRRSRRDTWFQFSTKCGGKAGGRKYESGSDLSLTGIGEPHGADVLGRGPDRSPVTLINTAGFSRPHVGGTGALEISEEAGARAEDPELSVLAGGDPAAAEGCEHRLEPPGLGHEQSNLSQFPATSASSQADPEAWTPPIPLFATPASLSPPGKPLFSL